MTFVEALERIATAVTFAEAAQWDTATEILQHRTKRRILVAYEGEPVNRALVDYSLSLSERIQCDLLYAYVTPKPNVARQSKDSVFSIGNAFQHAFAKDFSAISKRRNGFIADHLVVFDGFSNAVRTLCNCAGRIEFLVMGSASPPANLKLPVPHFIFK